MCQLVTQTVEKFTKNILYATKTSFQIIAFASVRSRPYAAPSKTRLSFFYQNEHKLHRTHIERCDAEVILFSSIAATHPEAGQEQVLSVAAEAGSQEFGIVQPPFMFKQAKTTAFTHSITVAGDEMSYTETTVLDIYDKKSYEHKDLNTLRRTG